MQTYKNMMENLVEDEYERAAASLGCCQCPQCRGDVIALRYSMFKCFLC